eukprot:scaffold1187_cov181-Ochromonas_danica.AAC.16
MMTAEQIVDAYEGLQNMRNNHPSVIRLLRLLNEKLASMPYHDQSVMIPPPQPQQQQQIMIYPVNGNEEGSFIPSKRSKQEHSPYLFTGLCIARALWGFRLMRTTTTITTTSSTANTTSTMDMLNQPSQSNITTKPILLQGVDLQAEVTIAEGEDENVVVVLEAMTLLARRIERSTAIMSAKQLAWAIYSLQYLNPNYPAVKQILLALIEKMLVSKDGFSGMDIGIAIYGLRFMDTTTSADVRTIIHILLIKMEQSNLPMDIKAFPLAYLGLVNTDVWLKKRSYY